MRTPTSFRQSAPDRLEIRGGGGCLSLFGLPFLAAGIFLILVSVQILRVSNADEVPLWAWPVMLLMGLCFVGLSSSIVFGRTRVTIDVSAGRVAKQWRLWIPVRQVEHSLHDYRAVALCLTAGDSDSSDSYDITLQGEGGRPGLALFSLGEYGPALLQAGAVAEFLRLPLLDITTDHQATFAWDQHRQNLPERLAGSDERPPGEAYPPPGMQSEVQLEGQAVRIRIPGPALSPFGLLGVAIPLALLLVFGPQVLRFFNATGTPRNIQICVSGGVLLLFAGLPLLAWANDALRARRGATIVTASPSGIVLEQRGAWRSQTITIPATQILGLDYSTPDSSLRAAARSALTPVGWASPSPQPAAFDVETSALAPVRLHWLGRVIKSKGIVIKSGQGLVTFGSGLPGPEVRYLWALVWRALVGPPARDPGAPFTNRWTESP